MKNKKLDLDLIASEFILLTGLFLFLNSGNGISLSPGGPEFSPYFWIILGSLILSVVFVFLLIVMKNLKEKRVLNEEMASKKHIRRRK
ncbi:hypothetical protein AUJ84_00690 [Candidatus Pacearchaeota archaeon CG1_02_32_132]|nr:MAG: hypothetical protein AUJ84_00690 [Candidatus Pacearchaeota archaeon CG1_02_32_132]